MTDDREQTRFDNRNSDRIVRTATEARQGEIVLGRRSRWFWIGSFALLLILVLVSALWW